jgi:hypothetical protein
MFRAGHYQLIVNFNALVNLSPHRLSPPCIFWKVPCANAFSLQVCKETVRESLVFGAVADEAGVELDGLSRSVNEGMSLIIC